MQHHCTPTELLCKLTSLLVPLGTLHLTHTRNVVQAPPKDSKQLFLQYAALEETYGLARSAMEVYDKAVRTVVDKERLEVYNLYLARATQFFGVGKVMLHLSRLSDWKCNMRLCFSTFETARGSSSALY